MTDRLSVKKRGAVTSSAWYDLERACLAAGVHSLFDKLERETVRVEKEHRRFCSGFAHTTRRYRLSVRVAALASALRWVARGPQKAPATWRDAAEIRRDIVLAHAIAEAIAPDWTDHTDALLGFDYANEID